MKYLQGLVLTTGLLFNLLSFDCHAQPGVPAGVFADITPETFAPTAYAPDSSAGAVYLFDRGEVTFDATSTNNHGFSIIFERHVRLRILDKNGMDLATLHISAVKHGGYNSVIDDVRGSTYNLEDGKVIVTKLDRGGIFKDRNSYLNIDKIAFPNVREGSIIEYTYRIIYPGPGYIPTWNFQGEYPVLWSEYEVTAPTMYDYFVKSQGYYRFAIDTSLYSTASFPVYLSGYHGTWSGTTIHHIWALADMPTLAKKEPYTTSLRNHIQKVEFQLSAERVNGYERTYRSNWSELAAELLKNPNFGESLGDRNHWMDDELKAITARGDTSLAAAGKIYAYVRDHLACSEAEGLFLSQPIKKTWEEKKGNTADVNMLLTAIYLHQGFEASPVILSTRAHGQPMDLFPILGDYDYVITRVRVDGQYHLLDASRTSTGFDQLPEHCYNGTARAIDSSHDAIPLLPDSVTERRNTLVFLSNDSAAGDFSGSYSRSEGIFESMTLRKRWKKEKPADFFENLKKTMAGYKKMREYGVDSLDNPEAPLSWHYDMSYHFALETIYFNPIMHDRIGNNPLSSPERHYPVEMPFRLDNSYVLRMEVPKGYRVDQLPKSIRYKTEDGGDDFEYVVDTDGKNINFHTRLQLKRTTYAIEEYQGLRDFFSLVIAKEKEPIIFKKID
jgi:hypothetical protein